MTLFGVAERNIYLSANHSLHTLCFNLAIAQYFLALSAASSLPRNSSQDCRFWRRQDPLSAVTPWTLGSCCYANDTGILLLRKRHWNLAVTQTTLESCCYTNDTGILLLRKLYWNHAVTLTTMESCCNANDTGLPLVHYRQSWYQEYVRLIFRIGTFDRGKKLDSQGKQRLRELLQVRDRREPGDQNIM